MQGSGAFLCLWEGESGASAHGEAGSGEPVGQDSLGILAAHGQQLVHREGGGAEDGLEGDGLDALSPQLAQGGQRDAEGGCEPSDADGEGIAALGARVGDALAVLVGDSQAGEGKGGCGRGGRAAAGRGRRLLGDNRSFRLHRAGDGDLLGLAISIGGGDFCARAQLVLDGFEVELTAVLREGLAVGTTSLGGQLEAARQLDVASAVDAAAAVAGAADAASGFDRTAGDGDVEAADAVAAGGVAASAIGRNGTTGDGGTGAGDAVAAGAITARAIASGGSDRTAGGDGDAAEAEDAAAAVFAAAAFGRDGTAGGDGDAAVIGDAVAAVAAVCAVAASGVDRTAGNGEAAEAGDAATAGAVFAVAAIGVDRTAGDGEVFAEDAAAAGAVCAAATLGRQAVSFAAGDGEAAAAGDAAEAIAAVVADTTGEMVVAIQLNRGIAAAGHTHGGFVPAAGVDVYILECDLDLIVPGVDGHGVGRSFVLVLICDDGVGVLHILIRPL